MCHGTPHNLFLYEGRPRKHYQLKCLSAAMAFSSSPQACSQCSHSSLAPLHSHVAKEAKSRNSSKKIMRSYWTKFISISVILKCSLVWVCWRFSTIFSEEYKGSATELILWLTYVCERSVKMLLIIAENKGLSQSNSLIWKKSRDGMFLNDNSKRGC